MRCLPQSVVVGSDSADSPWSSALMRLRSSLVISIPTDDMYYPALPLVICSGQFDDSTGRYRSNVIVFATLGT